MSRNLLYKQVLALDPSVKRRWPRITCEQLAAILRDKTKANETALASVQRFTTINDHKNAKQKSKTESKTSLSSDTKSKRLVQVDKIYQFILDRQLDYFVPDQIHDPNQGVEVYLIPATAILEHTLTVDNVRTLIQLMRQYRFCSKPFMGALNTCFNTDATQMLRIALLILLMCERSKYQYLLSQQALTQSQRDTEEVPTLFPLPDNLYNTLHREWYAGANITENDYKRLNERGSALHNVYLMDTLRARHADVLVLFTSNMYTGCVYSFIDENGNVIIPGLQGVRESMWRTLECPRNTAPIACSSGLVGNVFYICKIILSHLGGGRSAATISPIGGMTSARRTQKGVHKHVQQSMTGRYPFMAKNIIRWLQDQIKRYDSKATLNFPAETKFDTRFDSALITHQVLPYAINLRQMSIQTMLTSMLKECQHEDNSRFTVDRNAQIKFIKDESRFWRSGVRNEPVLNPD